MALGDFFNNLFKKDDKSAYNKPTDDIDKLLEETDHELAEINRQEDLRRRSEQRQRHLLAGIRAELQQVNVPVSPQSVNWLMQRLKAQQNEYAFIEQQMLYWREHHLELAVRQQLQRMPYPIPVIEQNIEWMVQAVAAQSNERTFIQQIMLCERQEYLARVIRYYLQNLAYPLAVNDHNVNWLMQYVNAQFQCQCQWDEASWFAHQMQLYWSGQPLPEERKALLKSSVIQFYRTRVAEYQKKAQGFREAAEEFERKADHTLFEYDRFKHDRDEDERITRLENIERSRRGLSPKRNNFNEGITDMQELIKSQELISQAKNYSFEFHIKSITYEELASKEQKRLDFYEQLGVEYFTEGLVRHLGSEPLEEPLNVID